MITKLTARKSERQFKLWDYQVSHGQLLIRSPKAPGDGDSPELLTNVDLVFVDVEYVAVPRILNGLELLPASPEEVAQLETILGRVLDPHTITVLESDGRRFCVVAASVSLHENDWDIFESPFEFRSHYRSAP